MHRYDLIVLRAGPAGSASAFVAARAGLRVALVDKHSFPRNKLCGGGVTGRALRHFQDIFKRPLPDCPITRRTDIRFGAFGRDLGQSKDIPPLYLIMRRDFDAALVQLACAAGATDLTGHRVRAIDTERPSLSMEVGTLEAPLLIAADGVNSMAAKALYGRAYDPDTIGFALEVEAPLSDDPADLRIDFGAADWGYGWQFPKHCGVTIGVGGVLRRNADMKAALAQYRAHRGVSGNLPVKGQFLPFGGYRKTPGRGGVLLAGDAAGLVDPITGEGIAYALRSGQIAAEAACAALAKGKPAGALSDYRQKLAPIHQAIRHARVIRPLMFAPSLRRPFISAFQNSTTLKADYFRLLAGELEYAQISRRLLRRLPRHAWRAILAAADGFRDPALPPP